MASLSTIVGGETLFLRRMESARVPTEEFVSRIQAPGAAVDRSVVLARDIVHAHEIIFEAQQIRIPALKGGKHIPIFPDREKVEEGRPLDAGNTATETGIAHRKWDTIPVAGGGFHLRYSKDPRFYLGVTDGFPVLSEAPAVWHYGAHPLPAPGAAAAAEREAKAVAKAAEREAAAVVRAAEREAVAVAKAAEREAKAVAKAAERAAKAVEKEAVRLAKAEAVAVKLRVALEAAHL
jgi:hypothetical protein